MLAPSKSIILATVVVATVAATLLANSNYKMTVVITVVMTIETRFVQFVTLTVLRLGMDNAGTITVCK